MVAANERYPCRLWRNPAWEPFIQGITYISIVTIASRQSLTIVANFHPKDNSPMLDRLTGLTTLDGIGKRQNLVSRLG